MQTLNCVQGLHNFLEFSQLAFVFRLEYINAKQALSCLNIGRRNTPNLVQQCLS